MVEGCYQIGCSIRQCAIKVKENVPWELSVLKNRHGSVQGRRGLSSDRGS